MKIFWMRELAKEAVELALQHDMVDKAEYYASKP